MRVRRYRTLATLATLAVGLFVLVPVLVSCSDGDDAIATSTDATADAVEEAKMLAELEASRATDERIAAENSMEPDDTQFTFGQELVLTDAGPVPATLVVIVDEELVIRNDGSVPIALRFRNGTVGADELAQTPAIEPGSTFAITPTRAVSVRYEYLGNEAVTGNLQIDTGDF